MFNLFQKDVSNISLGSITPHNTQNWQSCQISLVTLKFIDVNITMIWEHSFII